jgi:AmmeMemoRadiSam system protein A
MTFSEEDRQALIGLARSAVEASVLRVARRSDDALSSRFAEARGVFVTLRTRRDAELRGCIGYPEGGFPLSEGIVQGAEAAATRDTRFEPVLPAELPSIRIEISVLTPLRRVRPEDVRVGEDGLVVQREGRKGLLLPQVATEWGWDRETFLSQACRKAGLSKDAWKEPATELFCFQAEVFQED